MKINFIDEWQQWDWSSYNWFVFDFFIANVVVLSLEISQGYVELIVLNYGIRLVWGDWI